MLHVTVGFQSIFKLKGLDFLGSKVPSLIHIFLPYLCRLCEAIWTKVHGNVSVIIVDLYLIQSDIQYLFSTELRFTLCPPIGHYTKDGGPKTV